MMNKKPKKIDERTREYKAGYTDGLKTGQYQVKHMFTAVRGRTICTLLRVIEALRNQSLRLEN